MKASLCNHMDSGLYFLVPDLSAHGSEASAPYVLAAAEAAAIHQWLVSDGMNRLSLGFTASFGGVVLLELLRFPDLSFDRLFIGGVSFYLDGPVTRVGRTVLSRVMIAKHRGAVRDPKVGARKLQHLYGGEVAHPIAASSAAMSEGSIHAVVRDCSYINLSPLSPAIQRCCTFTYGERDSNLRLARRTIPRLYPEAELRVWPGWEHCKRMGHDSVAYETVLRNIALDSASTDHS